MAAALAQAGNSVCIVDLDLQFGDVCHYLQLEPEKTIFDAQQAIAKNEADFSAEEYSLSYKCGGSRIFGTGGAAENGASV